MKIIQSSNNWNPHTYNDIPEGINIVEAAENYGRTEDTVTLYTDEGRILAFAHWKWGYKQYSFCVNPEYTGQCPFDLPNLRGEKYTTEEKAREKRFFENQ